MSNTNTQSSKFFAAVEQTADAIFITDPDGTIRYVNPAFEHITGFTKEEAIGNKPSIIKSGMHSNDFYKDLWSTVLSGETFRATVVNRKKNGDLFYTDHSITPLKDKNGKIISFVGIWKDITEKVVMENRKDEFISIASHELKTPVTNIRILAEMIERKLEKEPVVSNYVQRMNKQIDKLVRLLNDLLDVSRIQAGKLSLIKEQVSLHDLIMECVRDIKVVHPSRIIEIKNSEDKVINLDAPRFAEVLINLLDNAIKYSPNEEKIEVDVKHQPNQTVISVRDHGKGIPSEFKERIFDRFFQLNKDTADLNSGLGLGLYISSQIVKLHAGKMWVESEVDKGSTFFVAIPN